MKSYNKKRKPKHSLMTGFLKCGKLRNNRIIIMKKRINISSKKSSILISIIKNNCNIFGDKKSESRKRFRIINKYRHKYEEFDLNSLFYK